MTKPTLEPKTFDEIPEGMKVTICYPRAIARLSGVSHADITRDRIITLVYVDGTMERSRSPYPRVITGDPIPCMVSCVEHAQRDRPEGWEPEPPDLAAL